MSTNDQPNDNATTYSTQDLLDIYGHVLLSPKQTSQKYHIPEKAGSDSKLCDGGRGEVDWLHKTHTRHLIFKELCQRCHNKLQTFGVVVDD